MKTLIKSNAMPLSVKREKGIVEVTFDLQKLLQKESSSRRNEPDNILRRIAIGRGLHYYLAMNEKFVAGKELYNRLNFLANDLQLISNEAYFSDRIRYKAIRYGITAFDKALEGVLEYVNNVEGGKEQLQMESGIDIDRFKGLFNAKKPVKKRFRMLVFRLLL